VKLETCSIHPLASRIIIVIHTRSSVKKPSDYKPYSIPKDLEKVEIAPHAIFIRTITSLSSPRAFNLEMELKSRHRELLFFLETEVTHSMYSVVSFILN
jgi:hypothetical protein